MIRLAHQLPVHSPLPPAAFLGALRRPAGSSPLLELTRLLADRFEARRVVLTGSGTQALNLAIRLATQKVRSRAVGLPGFCCYDIASAAVGADAEIALYDIDPVTLTPDLDSVERVLQSTGARVLVVAHLYGYGVDWDRLQDLASRYGTLLIEDSAQGHGGLWRGRPLGSLGGLSIMSFGRGKGWTGSGGGALLLRGGWEDTRVPELTRVGADWKVVAGAAAHWALGRPSLYGLPTSFPWLGLGETRYHEPEEPVGMRPVSAAIALKTLHASDLEALNRRKFAARLREDLRDHANIAATEPLPAATPGYLRFPVRLPRGLTSFPDERSALRAGVGRSYPTPLDALPQVVERLAVPSEIPGAEALARELVTLPVHSLLSVESFRELLKAVA